MPVVDVRARRSTATASLSGLRPVSGKPPDAVSVAVPEE
jgi:hypothetical protein